MLRSKISHRAVYENNENPAKARRCSVGYFGLPASFVSAQRGRERRSALLYARTRAPLIRCRFHLKFISTNAAGLFANGVRNFEFFSECETLSFCFAKDEKLTWTTYCLRILFAILSFSLSVKHSAFALQKTKNSHGQLIVCERSSQF